MVSAGSGEPFDVLLGEFIKGSSLVTGIDPVRVR
jgi:hypothetical protein